VVLFFLRPETPETTINRTVPYVGRSVALSKSTKGATSNLSQVLIHYIVYLHANMNMHISPRPDNFKRSNFLYSVL